MAYKDEIKMDLQGLRDCDALTEEQLKQALDWLDSQAAEKTLKELEETGESVTDATELCIFLAGMH